mmetsp:Transcript_20872/g.45254  ORF Transcript_20872/g.45254 Transcript_20872/m.45254 type:complete len:219 (-) Transcript_20872:23-679(-)
MKHRFLPLSVLAVMIVSHSTNGATVRGAKNKKYVPPHALPDLFVDSIWYGHALVTEGSQVEQDDPAILVFGGCGDNDHLDKNDWSFVDRDETSECQSLFYGITACPEQDQSDQRRNICGYWLNGCKNDQTKLPRCNSFQMILEKDDPAHLYIYGNPAQAGQTKSGEICPSIPTTKEFEEEHSSASSSSSLARATAQAGAEDAFLFVGTLSAEIAEGYW